MNNRNVGQADLEHYLEIKRKKEEKKKKIFLLFLLLLFLFQWA